MQLKRYTTEELQSICQDIFYDYMSSIVNEKNNITPASILYKEHQDKLQEYIDRIILYEEAIRKNDSNNAIHSLNEQLQELIIGKDHPLNSSMAYQKALYESTHSTDYCRSSIKIPLNKRINSYYDDFVLDVQFYDDVTTLKGRFSEYQELTNREDRRKFIEENTEITHMGLCFIRNNQLKALIGLKGNLNFKDPRTSEYGVTLLPSEFSDFENLTLKQISNIQNNDLKQFLQDKIDLDKEGMKELSSLIIRGDKYSIHQSSVDPKDFYIRYICRGTGRVYYNLLNLANLSISKYFNEKDYDSYSKAWWNLNTLGGDPEAEEAVIRS